MGHCTTNQLLLAKLSIGGGRSESRFDPINLRRRRESKFAKTVTHNLDWLQSAISSLEFWINILDDPISANWKAHRIAE